MTPFASPATSIHTAAGRCGTPWANSGVVSQGLSFQPFTGSDPLTPCSTYAPPTWPRRDAGILRGEPQEPQSCAALRPTSGGAAMALLCWLLVRENPAWGLWWQPGLRTQACLVPPCTTAEPELLCIRGRCTLPGPRRVPVRGRDPLFRTTDTFPPLLEVTWPAAPHEAGHVVARAVALAATAAAWPAGAGPAQAGPGGTLRAGRKEGGGRAQRPGHKATRPRSHPTAACREPGPLR